MNSSILPALVFLALFLSATPQETSTATSESLSQQEQNKTVAMRVFKEIFNQGKFQVADEIYARDFVNHGLHRDFNLAEDQAAARWEKTIAPDMALTVELIAADGDLVTVVWTARGTQTVRSGWLPATGVKFEERGITVWRIVNGKIRDEWTSFDQLRLIRQFVSQLKWILIVLLTILILVVWGLRGLIGRFRRPAVSAL